MLSVRSPQEMATSTELPALDCPRESTHHEGSRNGGEDIEVKQLNCVYMYDGIAMGDL